jgi:hypothetical protein
MGLWGANQAARPLRLAAAAALTPAADRALAKLAGAISCSKTRTVVLLLAVEAALLLTALAVTVVSGSIADGSWDRLRELPALLQQLGAARSQPAAGA